MAISQGRCRGRSVCRAKTHPSCIGCRPARCNSRSRTAPSPQATVSCRRARCPGLPLPTPLVVRKTLTRPAPASSNQAPGKGDSPRQWSWTSCHGLVQSMCVSSLLDLAGVGHARGRLRRQLQRAALQRGERAHHQVGAAPRQFVMQFAGGRIRRRSATRSAMAIGPGVEPFLHLHHHHAGLVVAGHDGALDRRRAAPARQQRGVEVEAAERKGIQNRLRQDQPVSDHDGGVGAMRAYRGGGVGGRAASSA